MPWPVKLRHSFLCFLQNWANKIFSSWDHSALWPYNKWSIPDKPQFYGDHPMLYENKKSWLWEQNADFFFFTGKSLPASQSKRRSLNKAELNHGGVRRHISSLDNPLTHRMLTGLYYEAGNDSNHMIFATIKQKTPICQAFLRQKAEIWIEWILKFL